MNFLSNGTVLPFGLLSCDSSAFMRGFNKTYRNTTLRMGVVMNSYSINDPHNVSGLTTEYDVIVTEQDENGAAATATYKNCLSVDALGSIADFFEKNFRAQTKDSVTGGIANTKGQNGAIVLIHCLDAMSEKGIVVGGINHPDRTTNLTSSAPYLEGEYNGINIKIENDGSTTLTFKGATDNSGTPIDSSQGNTELSIEKDGSYQVSHKTITQRFDNTSGVASLTATGNITNTTEGDFAITALQNMTVEAVESVSIKTSQLSALCDTASISCTSGSFTSVGNFTFQATAVQVQAAALVRLQAPVMIFNGLCNLGGPGGLNVLTLNTTMIGTGNLGIPVISRAVSGFANKVYAQ
jgi:hypothetical protein